MILEMPKNPFFSSTLSNLHTKRLLLLLLLLVLLTVCVARACGHLLTRSLAALYGCMLLAHAHQRSVPVSFQLFPFARLALRVTCPVCTRV